MPEHESKVARLHRKAQEGTERHAGEQEYSEVAKAGPARFTRSPDSPPPPVKADIDGDVSGAVRKALRGGGEAIPDPIEALQIETTRLLREFQKSEGRSPTVNDSAFWDAYKTLFKRRVLDTDDDFEPFGPGD